MAYISVPSEHKGKEKAQLYKNNFSEREAVMIYGDFTAFDPGQKQNVVVPAVTCAVALRAYLDKTVGWHKNISNVAISGVNGVTDAVSFDVVESSTDTNLLNSKGINVAINYKGFRIWGARTCVRDSLFAFEQYARTAQIIKETIANAYDWAIDKPMTPILIKEMVEMINSKMRFWKHQGYIIDGKAWVDWEENTKDTIKDGKFYIRYDFCPVPSLETLHLKQYITDEYLVDFASRVAQQ